MQKTRKYDRNEISDRAQSGTAAWLPRSVRRSSGGAWTRIGWHLGNPRPVVKLIRQAGALPDPFIHNDLSQALAVIGIHRPASSISMSRMRLLCSGRASLQLQSHPCEHILVD